MWTEISQFTVRYSIIFFSYIKNILTFLKASEILIRDFFLFSPPPPKENTPPHRTIKA